MGLANNAYATSVEAAQERSGMWGVPVFLLLLDRTRRKKEPVETGNMLGSSLYQWINTVRLADSNRLDKEAAR